MARALLHRLAESWPVGRAAALVERLDRSDPRVLRVLTYHRVDEPAPFVSHVEYLASSYRIVSPAQVVAALEGGAPLPRRAVLLTFDDGYRSFARVAWPALRARGLVATLFVPTSYPDSRREAFWWDRLELAFRHTTLRRPLETPLGALAMATAEGRRRSHALLKAYVGELHPEMAVRTTKDVCSALGAPAIPHEVLGWDELRELAGQGVTLGAHSRTHPRLDRIPRAHAREEILGSLADLEREVPEASRLFAYPCGCHDDEMVELLRSAAVELAFTTRRGTNDLHRCDPLRLRRIHVDANDSLAVLRARLAFTAARLDPARRLLVPPSPTERRAERANRSQLVRSSYVLRALDAVLTAGLERPAPARASSRFERIRRFTRRATALTPVLEERLGRRLVSLERLPLRAAGVEPRALGSGVTVFRLDPGGGDPPWALKVHRRTLGRDLHGLATAARRGARRLRRLRAAFGEVVLPGWFLVLQSPLRGARAVACLQPWLAGRSHDLLAFEDTELRAFLDRYPALARSFSVFVRRVLECTERGWVPDLLGAGNLLAVEESDGALRLRLIDYGIFEHRRLGESNGHDAALEALIARLREVAANG